jgi:3',5'-cyclic AMP phosphodiesterase CpdA
MGSKTVCGAAASVPYDSAQRAYVLDQERCGAASFHFVHIADPQLGMLQEDRAWKQELAQLERALDWVNAREPAFVMVGGDMTNARPETGAPYTQQVRSYKETLRRLKPSILVFHVPGNHDLDEDLSASGLAAYHRHFGSDYYQIALGDWLFVALNSSLIQHAELAPDQAAAQEQWLFDLLERVAGHPRQKIVLFQHIPWFLTDPDEEDNYFNIPLKIRAPLLDRLERAGVILTLAGHYHRNALGHYRKMEMLTNSALAFPLGDDPPGLRLLRCSHGKIEHEYHPLSI